MTAKPVVVGITGTIASGKSLVGKLLSQRGYTVIDTDHVVHELLESDEAIARAVEGKFGSSVISANGSIDRTALGAVVFSDDAKRKELEAILHPSVISECDKRIAQMPASKPVFVLAPLLFEAGIQRKYDEIWTVVTDESILRERLKKRNNLSDAEIDARLAAQWSQEKKAANSTRVIDNSGTIDDTTQKVDHALRQLLSKD